MAHPRDFSALRPPRPTPGEITCAGITLHGRPEDWIAAAGDYATPQEKADAGRFRHAIDAARRLVGRALARRMLGPAPDRPLTGDFALSAWGKPLCPPALPGPTAEPAAPDFSIAHSGDMVWVAVCQAGPVGIDVEHTRPLPDLHGLAAQLHPQERADILALPEPERMAAFFRCWTRKESVLKALGRGLALPLSGFRVLAGPKPSDWLARPPQEAGAAAWTTRDIEAGTEHRCSVAACAPGLALEVFLA